MKPQIIKYSALHAAGTVAYIALVATFMFNIDNILGSGPDTSILVPIAMLLLFVVSASITGSLVVGRPILWYLDGKKKEAVSLLISTIGFLTFAMICAFAILATLR